MFPCLLHIAQVSHKNCLISCPPWHLASRPLPISVRPQVAHEIKPLHASRGFECQTRMQLLRMPNFYESSVPARFQSLHSVCDMQISLLFRHSWHTARRKKERGGIITRSGGQIEHFWRNVKRSLVPLRPLPFGGCGGLIQISFLDTERLFLLSLSSCF